MNGSLTFVDQQVLRAARRSNNLSNGALGCGIGRAGGWRKLWR